MSKSYKKPIGKCCGGCSEKTWKRNWHKSFRHAIKQLLHNGEDENFPHYRQKSDIWDSPSDGKMYYIYTLPGDELFDDEYKKYFVRHYFKKNKKWLMYK